MDKNLKSICQIVKQMLRYRFGIISGKDYNESPPICPPKPRNTSVYLQNKMIYVSHSKTRLDNKSWIYTFTQTIFNTLRKDLGKLRWWNKFVFIIFTPTHQERGEKR